MRHIQRLSRVCNSIFVSGVIISVGVCSVAVSAVSASVSSSSQTFIVSSNADSGAGSLREAIETANSNPGADVILFENVNGKISLSGGQIPITDDVAIYGPGSEELTVSGNNTNRVFSIQVDEIEVVICDLTIAEGRISGTQALGGGILNDGASLMLVDMVFKNNEVVGEGRRDAIAGGGAVANIFGASLAVEDCRFADNHATATNRSAGGAILNDVDACLHVTDCEFTCNSASGLYLDLNRLYGGNGGAIANLGHSSATLYLTTFKDNKAIGHTGKDVPGQYGGSAAGGAISNAPSMIQEGQVNFGPDMKVELCKFIRNRAIAGAGGDAEGGVSAGAGGFAFGGAFQNDLGASAIITNSVFEDNLAEGGAGGNSFSSAAGGAGHEAGGGAILSTRSRLTVVGVTFTKNRSIGGRGGNSLGVPGGGGDARGGVMHLPGFVGFAQPGPKGHTPVASFTDVVFDGNRALGGQGGEGGAGRGGKGGFARGGALSTNEAALDIEYGLFKGNLAVGGEGGPGGTLGDGGHGYGGAVSNGNEIADPAKPVNWFTVGSSDFFVNVAVGGSGTTAGSGFGGAVMNGARAEAIISSTSIEANQAVGGSGIVTSGDGLGGGVFNRQYATLTLLGGSVITLNAAIGGDIGAEGFGGGANNATGGFLLVETLDAIFSNFASTDGIDWFGELTVIGP